MKFAILPYQFMFDPDEVWSDVYEFEKSLGQFLKSQGLKATTIKTIDGGGGNRMFFIEKVPQTPIDKVPTTQARK